MVIVSHEETALENVTRLGRLSRWLLAASAAFAGTTVALADVKAGVDAWSAGDYKAAIKQWQGPAERGDADAQFNLGQAYKLGRGVDQDLAKAESYYEKAAARGHLQAADNYGLLLFQRGERARAMPYVTAASERGDPRAQYILGLAHFNGDNAPRDWVRAYALVSLAQQAGLPQAASALKQMDQHVPLEQRQQSVPLAAELGLRAATIRASQVDARSLGSPATASVAATPHAATGAGGPASAGADFARPQTPVAATAASPRGRIEVPPPSPSKPDPRPAQAVQPAATSAAQGPWRAQLGAFGVAANAERMWSQVSRRPELAGRRKLLVPAGNLKKLQAGGFASQAEAAAACARLKAAGYACIAVKD